MHTDENVIAIRGSHERTDSAEGVRSVNSQDFFDAKIQKILCSPHFQMVFVAQGHH